MYHSYREKLESDWQKDQNPLQNWHLPLVIAELRRSFD